MSSRHLYTKSHEKRKKREEKLQQEKDKTGPKRKKKNHDVVASNPINGINDNYLANQPLVFPSSVSPYITDSNSVGLVGTTSPTQTSSSVDQVHANQSIQQYPSNVPLDSLQNPITQIQNLPENTKSASFFESPQPPLSIPDIFQYDPLNVIDNDRFSNNMAVNDNGPVFEYGTQGIDNYSWLFGTNFSLDMGTIPSNPASSLDYIQANANSSFKGNNDLLENRNYANNKSALSCERSINTQFQNPNIACEMDNLMGFTENVFPSGLQNQTLQGHASVNVRATFSQPLIRTVKAPCTQSLLEQQNLFNALQQPQPLNWNQHLTYNASSPATKSSTSFLHPVQDYSVKTEYQENEITGGLDESVDVHFTVNEVKHGQIIDILKYVPCLQEKISIFTPTRISEYLKLFWRYFDVVYPVIHKATFDVSTSEPELLIAMTTIGMAYCTCSEAYELAIAIHRKFRSMLLVKVGDHPQVSLWVHQSLLLTNYFVKLLGSRNQHSMSEMFHGTNIALLKLSGYLSDLKEPTPTVLLNTEQNEYSEQYQELLKQYWNEWVEYECRKRITFFAFICDTQHATLFRHTQGLSAFEINLELPCTDACWAASTPESFWGLYKCQPRSVQIRPPPSHPDELSQYLGESTCENGDHGGRLMNAHNKTSNSVKRDEKSKPAPTSRIRGEGSWPSLLFSIRRLMSPYRESQKEYALDCFSQFSRLILLHGLLSVCWDSQWRGLLDMGIVSKRRMSDFRLRLVQAIASWREYFDRQLHALNTPDFNLLLSANGERSYNRVEYGFKEAESAASAVRNRHNSNERFYTNSSRLNYYGNSPLLCVNWSLYNFSLVALYVDTSSIQIFAECMSTYSSQSNSDETSQQTNYNSTKDNVSQESSSLGRQQAVARSLEQLKAQKTVYSWAATDDAKWAVWHCSHFLSKAISNKALLSQADHVPWCLYLSVLCVWAYEVAQVAQSSQDEPSTAPYITSIILGFESEPGATSGLPSSQVNIDEVKIREDALKYISIIQKIPPKSIQTTPTASEDMLHQSQLHDSLSENPASSERQILVMSLIAYAYLILEKYDRGVVVNSKRLLHGLLDKYNQK